MTTTRGFSTLELLLALMIMSTTVSAVVLITLGLPSTVMDGQREELAANRAFAGLNTAFSAGLSSFKSVVSMATTTTDDGISSSMTVTLLPDNLTKNVVSTASWIDLFGHIRYEIFSGVITDFKNVQQSTCSNVLVGDWINPMVTTTQISSYPVSSVAVDSSSTSPLLVAASVTTQVSSDPNIHLFSIASTTNPVLISHLDTVAGTKSGPAALAVYNKIIYADYPCARVTPAGIP